MMPRPLATGDRVMILDGHLPTGWIAAITADRCTVLIAATARRTARLRVVFCDQVIGLAPAPFTATRLHEGHP